jgi:2'-5' RNA ligase
MRPVPAANCHITLAFIGEAGEADEAAIGDALRFADAPVTGLSLGAPFWLPRRRPRALALDVHDSHGELEACHSRLAAALAETVGWQPERRFRPHLTAVRLGRGVDPGSQALPVSPQIAFSGESVTLYRSLLLPEGARYEALSRVEL